jgi:hypothetical protein
MTNSLRSRLRDDSTGAIAVLVALLSIVIIGLAAFATDLGLAYNRARQLQSASDGAALAGAKQLADAAAPGLSCAAVLAASQTAADAAARSYAGLNAPPGSQLASGAPPAGWTGDAGVAFRCNPQRLAEVRVTSLNQSPSFFGRVFGRSAYDLSKPATAAMGPATQVVGLRPFSFCKNVVDLLLAQDKLTPGAAQVISVDKVFNAQNASGVSPTACGNAPGNWGTLGLDGSSNDPKNITLWTDVGYNKPIDLGSVTFIDFPGDPGFPSAEAGQCTVSDGCNRSVKTGDAFDDILGQPSVLPVFEAARGGGNNANFRVVGFLGVRICGWKLGNKQGTVPNSQFGGVACYDPTVPLPSGNDSALQIRITNFIPVGDLSLGCGLTGTPNVICENNPRVVQLIE